MDKADYFFHEWLILDKGIDKETYEKLTDEEFKELKIEFMKFCKNLK